MKTNKQRVKDLVLKHQGKELKDVLIESLGLSGSDRLASYSGMHDDLVVLAICALFERVAELEENIK